MRPGATTVTIAVAVALATGLEACGGSPHGSPGHRPSPAEAVPRPDSPSRPRGRPPTAREWDAVRGLMRAAERVRGLRFSGPIQVEVHDRQDIVEHLTQEVESEDLDRARVLYGALGLLPPDLDVQELLVRVLGEQVVGYYDHKSHRLVVRDDIMVALGRGGGAGAQARVTIVHELVHALQDVHLELGKRLDDDELDSDPTAAYQAVVEGDATLAMIAYLGELMGTDVDSLIRNIPALRMLVGQSGSLSGQELEQAPAILRITMMSAYVDGLLFAANLYRRGGWADVNRAHESPPVSVEQVLRPEKYIQGERPDTIQIPEMTSFAQEGYEPSDEDTLGQLEMGIYFGQQADNVDSKASEGWNGDRVRVYRRDREHAIVWYSTWDTPAQAREAETAARRVAQAASSSAPPDQGRHRVVRAGRALLVLRHVAPSLQIPAERAFAQWARGVASLP